MSAFRKVGRYQVFALCVLFIAGAEFLTRGPVRGLKPALGWNDFTGLYVAARAWVQGSPPYQPANLVRIWTSLGGEPIDISASSIDPVQARPVYPPTTLALVAPFAVLPWHLAMTGWILAETASVVVLSVMLASVLALPSIHWKLLFAAAVLALAPFHTGIGRGNPAVFSVTLAGLAVWASLRQRSRLAGLLLAISLCLKPPLGCALLLYYLLIRRDQRLSAYCSAAIAFVTVVAVGWLGVLGNHWWTDLSANLRWLDVPGTTADFTSANPIRFTMINLQVLVFAIFPSALAANVTAYALSGVLAAAFLGLTRSQDPATELVEASTVAVLSLLPIYHRSYEAAVVVLPLAWALAKLHSELAPAARISLALVAVFLVPGGALLQRLSSEGVVPRTISSQFWWDPIVMAHQTWALLGLSLVLLYARGSLRDRPAARTSTRNIVGLKRGQGGIQREHPASIWFPFRSVPRVAPRATRLTSQDRSQGSSDGLSRRRKADDARRSVGCSSRGPSRRAPLRFRRAYRAAGRGQG